MAASMMRMSRVLDQDGDAGSGVGSADADGVESPAVAQGDLAGLVDAVLPDPVVGVIGAVAGCGLGSAGVDRGWCGSMLQGPVGPSPVVLLGEGVRQGLEVGDGGGLVGLGAQPLLHGLLESFDLVLGLGAVLTTAPPGVEC